MLNFLIECKMSMGCVECGYKKHYSTLDFGHISGVKNINVSRSKSIAQAKKEIEKCEVVCANCHRTYNRLYLCKSDISNTVLEE